MNIKNRKIFQEVPDNINENWKYSGALVGGMAQYELENLAQSFKNTSDILISNILNKKSFGYELIYPIIFNYRHSIELYIKSILPSLRGHRLAELLKKLEEYAKQKYQNILPSWFSDLIKEIDDFDRKGTAFRYSDEWIQSHFNKDLGEFWIDLKSLKETMKEIERGFHWLLRHK